MLKFFNRLEKTRNAVLLLFAIVMVLSLVLFYRPSDPTTGSSLLRSEETAARVGSHYITVGELARQQAGVMERNPQGMPAKAILDSMIGMLVARSEAARLDLTASDAEVASAIRKNFKPTDGKPFDQAAYERTAVAQDGSLSAYEERMRDSLSAMKLRSFITSGVSVSEEELLNDYKRKATKFDLSYIPVNVGDLAKNISVTDQEVADYFEKNKASYHIDVPQKKVSYVFINTAKIGEKLPISDEELKAEFDQLAPDKKIAGVNGQEIVLRIPAPAQDQDVYAKATDIRNKLVKGGDTVTETEFSDLAKGMSENPATASNGGRLRGPVRENPNNPTDPYQQLLKMKVGEVSQPIGYEGRYFLLRRGEEVPKTFETAKPELEVSLRNRKAYTIAAELAQKVTDALKANKDVQKTAQEFAAQANMSVAEMVKETGYVKPGDDVPEIGNSPQFEQGIEGLNAANDVGDKIPIQNGFAVPLLVDKRDPRDADLAEVKDDVAQALKLERARTQVEEIAKQIASSATGVDNLASLAAAKGLNVVDAKGFVLGSPLGAGPAAVTSKDLDDAVFALNKGDVTKTPVKVGENWVIVGARDRTEANLETFAQERDGLREALLDQRRGVMFMDYMSETRRRFETDGSIKIYDDAVAKVDEEAASSADPFGALQDQ